MSESIRQSPVTFEPAVAGRAIWNDWSVVTAYAEEGAGPWLVDLSHLQRWDYQHINLDTQSPAGLTVPVRPGEVRLQHGRLVNRMNRTQVAIWHLDRGEARPMPDEVGFTDVTDAHCMLAVVGTRTPAVMEHVCNLDLFDPARQTPFLTQGPVMHIPCQLVTFAAQCLLMTFSRGFGQTFADALLHEASSCGLTPGGEDIFRQRGSRDADA